VCHLFLAASEDQCLSVRVQLLSDERSMALCVALFANKPGFHSNREM